MRLLRSGLLIGSGLFLAACHSGGVGVDKLPGCGGPAVVPWVDGVWVQPVPAWGSPVRLNLQLPIDTIVLSQLGAYGSHQGGHPEGLDHVWIQSTLWEQNGATTTIQSMAAGTVTKIENMGTTDGYYVTIDYGHGLIGKHLQILTPAVSVGDVLKEGDAVGQGFGITGEYMLMDENRCDGELSQIGGYSYVSPFDYLKPDVQAALIAKYQAQMVTPYYTAGKSYGTGWPWEPYLTNPMLFHGQHLGTIVGEWILSNKGWNPEDSVYYDKLTVMDVTNPYGHFQQYVAGLGGPNAGQPGGPTACGMGPWSLPDSSGKVLFQDGFGGAPCYGLYKVEENQVTPSGSTSKLTLEWSTQAYPTVFDSSAAVYYARLPTYAGLNATLLGR